MKKPRQTSTPAGADKLPTQSAGSTLGRGEQRNFVVSNVQREPSNDNPITLVGTVGRFGARQTDYGMAIDIADNSCQPCHWYDVVPTNPEMLLRLQQGTRVLVVVNGLLNGSWGYHPTVSATLQLLPDAIYPAVQLRLC